MITNERQYKITKAQLDRLEYAVAELARKSADSGQVSDALTKISLEALASEAAVLREQLLEFDTLKAGSGAAVVVRSLGDLPCALIRARIANGMSQRDLAVKLGLQEQQIQRYEATEYSTANLRRLLEVASAVDLKVSSEVSGACVEPDPNLATPAELDWSKFPIREMYQRRWFDGFEGSLSAALLAADTMVKDYIEAFCTRPTVSLHRKHVRSGSALDEYALLAWECRVLDRASEVEMAGTYSEGSITDEWTQELVRMSGFEDGPLRARQALADVGIPLIIEPHLAGTHLDGASLLWGDTPVVGMTLRYDRLDNFWFVLLHELAHIAMHLRKGKLTSAFDDLESAGGDRMERDADEYATEKLVPSTEWEHALARYVRSPETVTSFAEELGVTPAIVAGRIRRESNNYVILSDLVGSGQVRRLFKDVEFGA